MKNITLTLLAAGAIGAVAIGSTSAMPINGASAAPSESLVQDIRVVCGRYQRCYNTGRAYRSVRPYYAQRYYGGPDHYYGGPGYDYGYYGRPGVGVGIGPFGFGFGIR